LYGTDIDREAILWCQRSLGDIGEFSVNDDDPPLDQPDGYFDVLYAISVLTHLPEEMQFLWLGELERVLRPGGLAALSTHGEGVLKERSRHRWKRLKADGFLYMQGGAVEGLPDYYQNAFHTHTYIRRHWSEYFEIEAILPGGIAGHQDLVLCRKKS
jgi:2-polyprenyl-3-methyl-5-hydroxy-6-metoxy-1,4-benzoquinol methylase